MIAGFISWWKIPGANPFLVKYTNGVITAEGIQAGPGLPRGRAVYERVMTIANIAEFMNTPFVLLDTARYIFKGHRKLEQKYGFQNYIHDDMYPL